MWYLVLAYLLFGAGSGLVSTPITNTALSGLPHDQAGVAGAIASTCRQTGAAIGVTVCGSTGRWAKAQAERSSQQSIPQAMEVAR